MSDKQSNRIAFKDGTAASEHDLELIARAFGFYSVAYMNQKCAEADRQRAARANFGALAS